MLMVLINATVIDNITLQLVYYSLSDESVIIQSTPVKKFLIRPAHYEGPSSVNPQKRVNLNPKMRD